MIPADSDDVKKEFDVLLHELRKYNVELLDKKRILAITKSDMLDEELIIEMKEQLPEGIETLFISSVAQKGLVELKDKIWSLLQV
jgi:GTP-binding protein